MFSSGSFLMITLVTDIFNTKLRIPFERMEQMLVFERKKIDERREEIARRGTQDER